MASEDRRQRPGALGLRRASAVGPRRERGEQRSRPERREPERREPDRRQRGETRLEGLRRAAAIRSQDPEPSRFAQALDRGAAQIESVFPSVGGAVAGALGFEDTARSLGEQAVEIQQEAARRTPDVQQFTDIRDSETGEIQFSQLPSIAGQALVGEVPGLAQQAAGAVAGGLVGRRLGPPARGLRGRGRRAQEAPEDRDARAAAARRGTQAGALAGGVATGGAQATGELFPSLLTDPNADQFTTQELSRLALGGAAGSAALETLPVFTALDRLGLGRTGRDQLRRSLGRRVGAGALTQAASEGVTEVAQQSLQRGVQGLINEDIELFDDEGLEQLINAGFAGAVVGGATGGGLGALEGAARPRTRLGQRLERLRAADAREETQLGAARRRLGRLRRLDPEQGPSLDALEEEGLDQPEVQQELAAAETRLSRQLDPRPQIPFDERFEGLSGRIEEELRSQQRQLQDEAAGFERMIESREAEGSLEDPSTGPEILRGRRRALEQIEELENDIARVRRAREQRDARGVIEGVTDSLIDERAQLTPNLFSELRTTLEPFEAEVSDLLRNRASERVETDPAIDDDVARIFELETGQPLPSRLRGEEEVEDLRFDEDEVRAETFGMQVGDTRSVFIGQQGTNTRRDADVVIPFQSVEASEALTGGIFEEGGADRALRRMQAREPDTQFEKVSFRRKVEADARELGIEDPRRIRQLTDRQAQRLRNRMERARGGRERYVTDLFDDNDPSSFLDNFEVVQRTSLPPQLGRGADVELSPASFDALTRGRERRTREGELARGEIPVQVRRPVTDENTGEPRRTADGAPVLGEFEPTTVNMMDLATSMQDQVPFREGRSALDADRVADLVFEGLGSLLATPNREVRLDITSIPDDTVVFTQQREGQPNREYTFGEIRRRSGGRLRTLAQATEARAQRARAQGNTDQARALEQEARRALAQARGAERASGRERERQLMEAQNVLANRDRFSEEQIAEAEAVMEEATQRFIEEQEQRDAQALQQERDEETRSFDQEAATGERTVDVGDPTAVTMRTRGTQGGAPVQPEASTVERRFRYDDREYTPTGRLVSRLDKADRAIQTLSDPQTRIDRARRAFEQAFVAGLPSDVARPVQRFLREQRSLESLRNRALRERGRIQQQLWDTAHADRAAEVERSLGVSLAEARRNFFRLFGGVLPDRATATQIREAIAQEESIARQVMPTRAQLNDEQQMLRGWLQGLGIDANVRIVGRNEIQRHGATPENIAAVDSGHVNGIMRRVGEGEYVVFVRGGLSREARVETFAHEMGHVVFQERLRSADTRTAEQLYEAFSRWRKEHNRPDNLAIDAISSKAALAQLHEFAVLHNNGARIKDIDPEYRDYLFDFEEWFADNTARWLTQTRAPRSVVERFFKDVADAIKALYQRVAERGGFRTDPAVAGFLRSLWEHRAERFAENIQTEARDRAVREHATPEELERVRRDVLRFSHKAGRAQGGDAADAAMDAARAQNDRPYDTDAHRAFKRMYDQLLTDEERRLLARAFTTPYVRRQLAALVGNEAVMGSIDRGNGRLAAAYGFQFWLDGSLELGPESNGLFTRLKRFLEDVFGIMTEDTRALNVLSAIQSGHVAARQQGFPVDKNITRRFREANRVEEMGSQVVQIFEKVTGPFQAFMPALSRRALRRVPALDALIDEFSTRSTAQRRGQSMFEARVQRIGQFNDAFVRATENLSKEQGREVLELLQNPTREVPDNNVGRAVQAVRTQLREMFDYANARGMEIRDRGEDYFPWVFDPDSLMDRHQEFINLISQEKFAARLAEMNGQSDSVPQTEEERRYIAERIYDALIQNNGYADSPQEPGDGAFTPFMASANARQLGWIFDDGDAGDREQLTTFFSKDLGYILAAYTEQIVKRSEFVTRFGRDGSGIERRFAQARAQGATDADIETARTFIAAMMGSLGREMHPALRHIITTVGKAFGKDWSTVRPDRLRSLQGAMIVYQNVRVLGLATLTSVADTAGIVVRSNDLGVAFEGFKQGMREIGLGIRAMTTGRGQPQDAYRSELRRLAESLGTIDMHLVNEVLGEAYGGTHLTGTARKVNETFFRAIQLQRWTRFSRIMALASAKRFLERTSEGAFGQHRQRFLEQLNLREEDVVRDQDGQLVVLSSDERREIASDIQRWRELLSQQDNAVTRRDLEGNIRDAEAELLRDDRIRTALNRFVDQSVLRPNPSQRPLWASHPDAQLFFHLKQFMYTIHTQIVQRTLSEVTQGNYWPIMAAFSYIPVMVAADLLRDWIQHGEEGDPRKRNWTFEDYAFDGIHRSGVLGLGTMVLDAHKDRTQFGGTGFESLAGPTVAQAQDMAGVLAGDRDIGTFVRDALPANNIWKEWDFEELLGEPWTVQSNSLSGFPWR